MALKRKKRISYQERADNALIKLGHTLNIKINDWVLDFLRDGKYPEDYKSLDKLTLALYDLVEQIEPNEVLKPTLKRMYLALVSSYKSTSSAHYRGDQPFL